MDLIVPGAMGGKDALQELLKRDPQVRAVASSGYSTDPIMGNYQEYGFVAALSKPYKIRELYIIVQEAINPQSKS
jgi:DNA-binding NtrC family response regulator